MKRYIHGACSCDDPSHDFSNGSFYSLFVGLHGEAVLEVVVSADGGVAVALSPLRSGSCVRQPQQDLLLQVAGFSGVAGQLLAAAGEVCVVQKPRSVHSLLETCFVAQKYAYLASLAFFSLPKLTSSDL